MMKTGSEFKSIKEICCFCVLFHFAPILVRLRYVRPISHHLLFVHICGFVPYYQLSCCVFHSIICFLSKERLHCLRLPPLSNLWIQSYNHAKSMILPVIPVTNNLILTKTASKFKAHQGPPRQPPRPPKQTPPLPQASPPPPPWLLLPP